jgi:RNA polymerase sigma-70 factor (ECF subfamily)
MNLSKKSDEELALFMQQNNGQGIEVVIDRYQGKLLRYVTGITKDPDKSEDVVQETFISVFKNINSFDIARKFSSWIYRIAHNKAISEIRKHSFLGLEAAFNVPGVENLDQTITKELDKEKTKKLILAQVNFLPLKYRETIQLRYLEEKSYEEISDILRISINTVGVRIKRGLEKLKKSLNINPEDYL